VSDQLGDILIPRFGEYKDRNMGRGGKEAIEHVDAMAVGQR